MTHDFIVHLFRETFTTIMIIAGPLLLASLVVGLIISIVQAATSIQEFTLTFVPKIIVLAILIVLILPWMMDVMLSFTREVWNQIPNLGG